MDRSFLAGLVFFAIFVAGIITGVFSTARWARYNQVRWQKNSQQQVAVPPLVPGVIRQMLNQLDLTRDQRKTANKLLLDDVDTLRILRRETDFALDRMQEDIDKILTPDQRVKLGKLKDEQRAKLLEQREAVHHFLEQRRHGEAVPAAPVSGDKSQPPPPAAAAPADTTAH